MQLDLQQIKEIAMNTHRIGPTAIHRWPINSESPGTMDVGENHVIIFDIQKKKTTFTGDNGGTGRGDLNPDFRFVSLVA